MEAKPGRLVDVGKRQRESTLSVTIAARGARGERAEQVAAVKQRRAKIRQARCRLAPQPDGQAVVQAIAMERGQKTRAIVTVAFAQTLTHGAHAVSVFVQSCAQRLVGKVIRK